MVRTLATTAESNTYMAGYDASNRAVHLLDSSVSEAQIRRQTLDKALQIASALQTTLEIDKVIEFFSREIASMVPHTSMAYVNHDEDLTVAIGKPAHHSCTYRLVIMGESLGQLSLSRRKEFTSDEVILLEYLLCSLVYPLRNTILYRQAVEAALTDPLTGTHNRAAMDTTLHREIDLSRRHNLPLSLIVLDIDRFKQINDNFGHTVGDNVLKALVECIKECIRSTDILFRYGGEEFTVVLNNTDHGGAVHLAERIRAAVEQSAFNTGSATLNATVSIGVATLQAKENGASFFQRADQALYRAKAEGRNRIRLAEDIS